MMQLVQTEQNGSSQGGYLLFFTDENIQCGPVAPMCLADWETLEIDTNLLKQLDR